VRWWRREGREGGKEDGGKNNHQNWQVNEKIGVRGLSVILAFLVHIFQNS
jgi:hypothetical protein